MKWFRRTPAEPSTVREQANPTRIAVLEYDLLDIRPESGSAAALAIALRRTGTCLTHRPVETTIVSDIRPTAVCAGCGRAMVETDGQWAVAGEEER
ncbi:hypothetical protein [Kitasatospora sp. NPDC058478]|uniref:hypothetical protein n=1 Tax=unclassified Kitasatospora TaxID=2633591 RepID=UPI003660E8FC